MLMKAAVLRACGAVMAVLPPEQVSTSAEAAAGEPPRLLPLSLPALPAERGARLRLRGRCPSSSSQACCSLSLSSSAAVMTGEWVVRRRRPKRENSPGRASRRGEGGAAGAGRQRGGRPTAAAQGMRK